MNLYKTTIATDGYGSHSYHTESVNMPVAVGRAEVKADAHVRKEYYVVSDRALKHVVTGCELVEQDWQ